MKSIWMNSLFTGVTSFFALLSIVVFIGLLPRTSIAQDNIETVYLDGIASVIRFRASDDSSAILVLASDVELMARILMVAKHGSQWQEQEIDDAARYKARRLAVIVKILAHVAEQIGEKNDVARRDRMIQFFTRRSGGEASMTRLLSLCGANKEDLKYWFSSFYLSRVQLQYMMDQIQMPTKTELKKMFEQGEHPLVGASWDDAKQVYEKMTRDKKLQQIVAQWLAQFDSHGSIHFADEHR